ncbi:hypothetical protein Krac_9930 [Ktedonobacter racemifer DSM 44963]|uniref:Uncharacterized protein n=1 Tax=Ktedonobacter racemifer DSM 44963 TaxID=485913 RepID=D6TE87_KTERA|nr:hypothetical protein Krac_9930 [Ktedonobacter racemifer DSM 44963]
MASTKGRWGKADDAWLPSLCQRDQLIEAAYMADRSTQSKACGCSCNTLVIEHAQLYRDGIDCQLCVEDVCEAVGLPV